LALFTLGPIAVLGPALGATYLAPLRELLDGEVPDLTLWCYGKTGGFKSELVVLLQSHYGNFTRTELPGNFAATANAIERLTFTAKDALLGMDDYHPAGDAYEAAKMAQVASRLLRGVGNGTGRSRMAADTRLRPDLPPRTVPVVTAERLITGTSTAARMFPVPIAPGDIQRDVLTVAQARRGQLSVAMAAYLQWLAREFASLHDAL